MSDSLYLIAAVRSGVREPVTFVRRSTVAEENSNERKARSFSFITQRSLNLSLFLNSIHRIRLQRSRLDHYRNLNNIFQFFFRTDFYHFTIFTFNNISD